MFGRCFQRVLDSFDLPGLPTTVNCPPSFRRVNAPLAKPNYSFEKRQREIASKKKKDEKEAKKREARDAAKAANADPDAYVEQPEQD